MVWVSAWIDGSSRFAVVATEADREQVLPGDSPFGIQQFRMDRHLAGPIAGPITHGFGKGAAIAGSGNRLEPSPHDLKGLPQQKNETTGVEQGKESLEQL